jgi:DNA-binding NtrC family response regulator
VCKILVADSNAEIWDIMRDVFSEAWGGTVRCVASGREAAEVIVTSPVDLLITSVILPEISGFRLAEIAARNKIPVLLMSGDLEAQNMLEQVGLVYLQKPFRLLELRRLAGAAICNPHYNAQQTLNCLKALKMPGQMRFQAGVMAEAA